MRIEPIAIFLLAALASGAWAAADDLETWQQQYQAASDKAKLDYDAKVKAAKNAYVGRLNAALASATRQGNNERVIIVRDLLNALGVTPDQPQAAANAPKPAQRVPTKSLVCGQDDGKEFCHVINGQGFLVGLRMGWDNPYGNWTIVGIQPMYMSFKGKEDGPIFGWFKKEVQVVEAKPGYAVGKVETLKGFKGMKGVKVTFARIKGALLDSTDTYVSDWVGAKPGEIGPVLNPNLDPVIGIYGTHGGLAVPFGVVTLSLSDK